jgi:WD40 repeat protein
VLQRSPRLSRFLPGLAQGIDAADVSNDGSTLAVAGSDSTVRLFDPRTGRQLSAFPTGQTGQAARVLLSPDAQTVVTLGGDTTVRLWDRQGHPLGPPLGTGSPVNHPTAPEVPKGAFVRQAAFSPDGRQLVTVDQTGHGLLWDVTAERALAELPVVNLPGFKYDVAFSPDGRRIAIAGAPSLVIDSKTMQTVFRVPPGDQAGADTAVAFSPDGRLLASANGSVIDLWDLGGGREARPALPAGGVVTQVQFSADGRFLAGGRDDGTTQLWDARTFEPSGGLLVGQQGEINRTAFVSGSPLLVTATSSSVAVWDTALVRPLGSSLPGGGAAAVTSVAFSSDGRSVASTAADGRVELWQLSGGQPTGPPQMLQTNRAAAATAVSFIADNRLAVGMSDGSIVSLDAVAGRPTGPALAVGPAGVTALAFARHGDLLAVGTADGKVALVDSRRWSTRRVITSHQSGPATGLAFSPDGSLLASSGHDGHLILDDLRHSRSAALAVRAPETMGGVAYRPDGRTVAASFSGGVAVIVKAPDGTRSTPLFPGGGAVQAVGFSPNGRVLAAGSADGTVSLWDAGTQKRVGPPLAGPVPELRALAYSPTGRELMTGSSDGTTVIWNVDPPAWAARACELAGRALTRQEWAQLLPGRAYHPTCTESSR